MAVAHAPEELVRATRPGRRLIDRRHRNRRGCECPGVPKVVVYPSDTTGCGQFRLIQPALALKSAGHDISIEWPTARSGFGGGVDETGKLHYVDVPDGAEVIVIQRPALGLIAQAVPMIRAKGVAVAVDMDDDLTCINPNNPAYPGYHPAGKSRSQHSWHHASDACRDATLVTTSAVALQRTYAAHGRGVVLHNRIPAGYLGVPRIDSDVIGWGGSVHSHPDDLQTTGTAIARLVDEGHRFQIVGPVAGVRDALRLPRDPPATGPVDMARWPHALSTLGVGIAPLADTKFNSAKSFLKILEMSGLGVPWVASPRAEYQRFHGFGAGLLARKPQQWYARLRELATNAALREEMSQAGRAVAAEHTIEGNAYRWWEAWEEAWRIQRAEYRPAAGGPIRQPVPVPATGFVR